MLTIIETPHSGKTQIWSARDENDFCTKVMNANPRGDWKHYWTFEQFVEYLASDLRGLQVMTDQ